MTALRRVIPREQPPMDERASVRVSALVWVLLCVMGWAVIVGAWWLYHVVNP